MLSCQKQSGRQSLLCFCTAKVTTTTAVVLQTIKVVFEHEFRLNGQGVPIKAQDETFDPTEDISDFKTEPQFEKEDDNLDETFDDFSDGSSQPPPAKKIKSEFQFVDVPSKNSKSKRKPDGKLHKCEECNKT